MFPHYEDKGNINRSLILNEAARRGIKIEKLPEDEGYFLLEFNGHYELTGRLNTGNLGFAAGNISKDKFKTKYLLRRAGLKVPDGKTFTESQKGEIVEFIGSKKTVVKPNDGCQGEKVWMELDASEALEASQQIWNAGYKKSLIEEYVLGEVHRIYATQEGFLGVYHRKRPNVLGDGKKTLKELISKKNETKGIMPRNGKLDWPPQITVDQDVLSYLKEQKIDLSSIIRDGETVFLRKYHHILGVGEDTITFEESELDPKVKDLAMATLDALPGMTHAGIDIITKDIRNLEDYVILEINKTAGLTTHHFPCFGKPQNVAGALVDQMFPETIGY
jgi:cyanophycin synthetase